MRTPTSQVQCVLRCTDGGRMVGWVDSALAVVGKRLKSEDFQGVWEVLSTHGVRDVIEHDDRDGALMTVEDAKDALSRHSDARAADRMFRYS